LKITTTVEEKNIDLESLEINNDSIREIKKVSFFKKILNGIYLFLKKDLQTLRVFIGLWNFFVMFLMIM
jgi:hypothetical protein